MCTWVRHKSVKDCHCAEHFSAILQEPRGALLVQQSCSDNTLALAQYCHPCHSSRSSDLNPSCKPGSVPHIHVHVSKSKSRIVPQSA